MKNRIYLLENHLSLLGRRAIEFYLQGSDSNSMALGSMVMLYTEREGKKIVQRRYHQLNHGGISSQLAPVVHFGVDSLTKIVGVKVRWPVKHKRSVFKGKSLERLYPIHDVASDEHQIFTICENGAIHSGRFSCF